VFTLVQRPCVLARSHTLIEELTMKTLKASLAAAAGLIVLTATLTLTDSGKAAAQPMKSLLVHVTNTTAEAVPVRTVLPAADRVQLEYRGGSGEPCPSFASPVTRVLPDATTIPDFAVPAGRMLILTDVVGVVRPGIPWTAGFVAVLNVGTNLPLAPVLRAYEPLTPEAVSAEVAFVPEHLQSGFVVGPNLNVCVSASLQHGSGGGTAQVVQARLIGYLIDE
jgi:hypothetical protein